MDLVNSLENRLLLAVPKKGRLQQASLDLLSGSDIQFRREHRLDIALVKNHDIALIFLPAADIPTFVGEGRVDLGITGRDQVAEYTAVTASNAQTPDGDLHIGLDEVMDLGFGACRLMVQVPEKGPYTNPKELVGKNIVTSFVGLTIRYFAKLEGIDLENGEAAKCDEYALRRKLKTRIKYVGGSVEAACALGVADGIVDLVESGETMRAAGLKSIDTVVDSTAVLIKSKKPSNKALADLIAARIRGFITAKKYVMCQYNIPRDKLQLATKYTPGKRAPTITALEEEGWVAVSSMVLKNEIANVMDQLSTVGATDILVLSIMNARAG